MGEVAKKQVRVGRLKDTRETCFALQFSLGLLIIQILHPSPPINLEGGLCHNCPNQSKFNCKVKDPFKLTYVLGEGGWIQWGVQLDFLGNYSYFLLPPPPPLPPTRPCGFFCQFTWAGLPNLSVQQLSQPPQGGMGLAGVVSHQASIEEIHAENFCSDCQKCPKIPYFFYFKS